MSITNLPISAVAMHLATKDLSEEDQRNLRRRLGKGTRTNLKQYLLGKIFKNNSKLVDKALPEFLDNLGRSDLKENNYIRYGVAPAIEGANTYLTSRKFLNKLETKKEANFIGDTLKETGSSAMHPISLYQNTRDVASGQKSLGEAAGNFAVSTATGVGISKLFSPLIKAMPDGWLKGTLGAANYIGSGIAGSILGNKAEKLMKPLPIYKRPGYDKIQQYNNE